MMKKMQMGGVDPGKKKARLTKRANTKMSKAQKTWREAEASKADAIKSNLPADEAGTNQLYTRAQKQAEKAKKLKAKASMMKTGGMVNPNSKVSALKKAGTKGVKSNVNPKAKASKVAKGRVGGISTAPKKATPDKK